MAFNRLNHSQFGAISTLFTEKFKVEEFINILSNILIKAVKSINNTLIRIDALEHCQKLKIDKLSLVRYLDEEKIKMLYQEIESSIRIQLKMQLY